MSHIGNVPFEKRRMSASGEEITAREAERDAYEPEEEEFLVEWSCPLVAEGPIDAARQALGMLQDPYSIATVFIITDPQGQRFKVDLDPSLGEDEYEADPLS